MRKDAAMAKRIAVWLLGAAVAGGVLFAAWTAVAWRARQAAVADLQRRGAVVEFGPGETVVGLQFNDAVLDDSAAASLARLDTATAVVFERCVVPASVFRALAAHEKLSLLAIRGCGIDDAGMQRISALKRVELLDLDSSDFPPASLGLLAGMPMLRWLDLRNTPADLESVGPLKVLPSLRVVFCEGSRIPPTAAGPVAGTRFELHFKNVPPTPQSLEADPSSAKGSPAVPHSPRLVQRQTEESGPQTRNRFGFQACNGASHPKSQVRRSTSSAGGSSAR